MTADTRRPLPRFRHDQLPAAMYAPEPDRHVYLAPYIGGGTETDPFRPRGVDDIDGWSCIDLRPDASVPDSGHAIVVAPSRLPVRDEAHAVYLGDDPDLPLPTLVRQHVEDRANVGRGDLPSVMRGNQCIVADLLTLMADDGDPTRPNVLRPERDKVLRIYLGGEVWWEKALPAGGSTFIDNFDRGPESLETSSDWDVVSGSATVDGGTVTSSAVFARTTWEAPSNGDMYAEGTITEKPGNNNTGALVRVETTANLNLYGFRSRQADPQTWELFKFVNGTFTAFASFNQFQATPYVERCEVEGSTLRGYINGTLEATQTDTSLTAGRLAGFRTTNGATWSRFESGVLGDPGIEGALRGPNGGLLRGPNGGLLRLAP